MVLMFFKDKHVNHYDKQNYYLIYLTIMNSSLDFKVIKDFTARTIS